MTCAPITRIATVSWFSAAPGPLRRRAGGNHRRRYTRQSSWSLPRCRSHPVRRCRPGRCRLDSAKSPSASPRSAMLGGIGVEIRPSPRCASGRGDRCQRRRFPHLRRPRRPTPGHSSAAAFRSAVSSAPTSPPATGLACSDHTARQQEPGSSHYTPQARTTIRAPDGLRHGSCRSSSTTEKAVSKFVDRPFIIMVDRASMVDLGRRAQRPLPCCYRPPPRPPPAAEPSKPTGGEADLVIPRSTPQDVCGARP